MTLPTTDLDHLLETVRRTIVAAGFVVTQINAALLSIDAKREDSGSRDYDRVIVWLERSAQRPLEAADLYLLYGRYEEVIGRTTGLVRVVVDDDFEEQAIGSLRSSLLALGGGR